MHEALHDLIAFQASQRPDGTALVYKAEELSYGAAWEHTKSLAAGLLDLGLERHDRLAVYLHNSIGMWRVELTSGYDPFIGIRPSLRAVTPFWNG